MTDWQKYRNGSPGQPWDLERLARHRAAKFGYRVHRSRRRKGPDNAGKFMLIHKASSTVLLGARFTASAEIILEFIERERMHSLCAISANG
jgi:tRNA 2-selenouridine synthase SelU